MVMPDSLLKTKRYEHTTTIFWFKKTCHPFHGRMYTSSISNVPQHNGSATGSPCYRAVIMAERMLQSCLSLCSLCFGTIGLLIQGYSNNTRAAGTLDPHSPCRKCIPISTEQESLTEMLIWCRCSVRSSAEHSCTKAWMVWHNSWMWFHCSFNLINLCSQFTVSCHSSETYLPT